MYKPLELFVGLRYTRAKRRNHFISFISMISILGIVLGVTALITVMSVMNGFEKEIRHRILGAAAHGTIVGAQESLRDWTSVVDLAGRNAHVTGAAPYVDGEGMLTSGSQVRGTLVRGILPAEEPKVSEFGNHMVVGRLADLESGEYRIILGIELARKLGVLVSDKVTLVTPRATMTPVGMIPRLKRFTVVGVFDMGMYEYDSALALLHMDDAARLFELDGGVSGVRLKLDDLFLAPRVTRELAAEFPGAFRVSDWTQQHVNYFRAVKTEKRVMFIILLLIVSVAAFNIVSTLVMLVTDKESDIAVLRTLGASPASIMMIFIIQGTVVGLIGTALGVAGGVTLALNVETLVPAIEKFFSVSFFPADVYYISEIPSDMHRADVVTIAVVSFLLTVLATIYPAWRAARIEPAEALRYE
ncbi:MAG: lipoprotein-releasing system permease protein [Gammaproteobacteria bacterium]|nr:MAG: lipoprotein-releasing system permease protein [Gammaproteobacteria bacterium]TND06837.1 MAG: lipoprotein-releasing system permease protein [Gammaproteobacteria bacterium]